MIETLIEIARVTDVGYCDTVGPSWLERSRFDKNAGVTSLRQPFVPLDSALEIVCSHIVPSACAMVYGEPTNSTDFEKTRYSMVDMLPCLLAESMFRAAMHQVQQAGDKRRTIPAGSDDALYAAVGYEARHGWEIAHNSYTVRKNAWQREKINVNMLLVLREDVKALMFHMLSPNNAMMNVWAAFWTVAISLAAITNDRVHPQERLCEMLLFKFTPYNEGTS